MGQTPAGLSLRAETAEDVEAIAALTARAFAGHPYSDGSEVAIVERLRAQGGLVLSLVAAVDGRIAGHAAFSPAGNAQAPGYFALGPISVEPALQRRGIGCLLIESGFRALRERGAAGCIVLGDPAYYGRFGFAPAPQACPPGLPATHFMVASFGGEAVQGTFAFHPAFG